VGVVGVSSFPAIGVAPQCLDMADVLQGATSHAQWAPLSTGTTIAINRHLQEQIEALQANVVDVNIKLKETVDALEDLRKSVPTPNSTAEVKLRDDVAQIRVYAEDNRNDINRTDEVVTKIQNGLGDNRDSIVRLQDMQKKHEYQPQQGGKGPCRADDPAEENAKHHGEAGAG